MSERRSADERTSLRRVAAAVVAGSDPAAALGIAAGEVAALMDAEQGFVFRFEGDRVIVAGVHGVEESPVGAVHEMLEHGVLPLVFRGRAPARVEGVPRPLGRRNSDVHWIAPVYTGGIGAPVFVGEHLWGAVVAATTRGEPFPPGAESRLGYFAEIAGIAIGNAEANERLAQLAATDPLTGLANHRVFHQTLADEIARAVRHDRPLTLAVIDIDHFKGINDTHGHLVGDRALIETARRLARCSRRGDLVARVGGEEFAWVIPEVCLDDAMGVAERARRQIAAEPYAEIGLVTVSIGLATFAPGEGGAELYRRADAALYAAKSGGRNRVEASGVMGRRPPPEPVAAQPPPVVASLVRMMEALDPALATHCRRVAACAEHVARAAGWPHDAARRLAHVGLVMGVGAAVLPDPQRDPAAEAWAHHPVAGAAIVSGALATDQIAWLRAHHERWDGTGVPDGAAGEAIPLGARILAVADCWERLVAPQPAGEGLPPRQALRRIDAQADEGALCPVSAACLGRAVRSGALALRT